MARSHALVGSEKHVIVPFSSEMTVYKSVASAGNMIQRTVLNGVWGVIILSPKMKLTCPFSQKRDRAAAHATG